MPIGGSAMMGDLRVRADAALVVDGAVHTMPRNDVVRAAPSSLPAPRPDGFATRCCRQIQKERKRPSTAASALHKTTKAGCAAARSAAG